MLKTFAVCKNCGGQLEIVEKTSASVSLGKVWQFSCTITACDTSKSDGTVMTPKNGRYFEINRMLVLAMRSIGKGHFAAKKILRLMNLQPPVHPTCWRRYTKVLTDVTEELLENNLKEEAFNVKRYLQTVGQIDSNIDEQTLRNQVIKISASVDGSWGTRAWSSRDGIVDICFEETGKILDVIIKSSKCRQCLLKTNEEKSGKITELEYLERYTKHEADCLMNHEGSSSVC